MGLISFCPNVPPNSQVDITSDNQFEKKNIVLVYDLEKEIRKTSRFVNALNRKIKRNEINQNLQVLLILFVCQ